VANPQQHGARANHRGKGEQVSAKSDAKHDREMARIWARQALDHLTLAVGLVETAHVVLEGHFVLEKRNLDARGLLEVVLERRNKDTVGLLQTPQKGFRETPHAKPTPAALEESHASRPWQPCEHDGGSAFEFLELDNRGRDATLAFKRVTVHESPPEAWARFCGVIEGNLWATDGAGVLLCWPTIGQAKVGLERWASGNRDVSTTPKFGAACTCCGGIMLAESNRLAGGDWPADVQEAPVCLQCSSDLDVDDLIRTVRASGYVAPSKANGG